MGLWGAVQPTSALHAVSTGVSEHRQQPCVRRDLGEEAHCASGNREISGNVSPKKREMIECNLRLE